MFDYCQIFADRIATGIGEDGATISGATFYPGAVYAQTNPARVWSGTPTVEIMEGDVERAFYLSGKFRNAVKMEIAARTQTRAQASGAAVAFKNYVRTICAALVSEGKVDDFTFDASRIYPDERGRAIGESFYSVLSFTLYEPVKDDADETES